MASFLQRYRDGKKSVQIAAADYTHSRCHPALASELRYSTREAADLQPSGPGPSDLRSENPLRGWYLVPWSNRSHRPYQLRFSRMILTFGVLTILYTDVGGLMSRALGRYRFIKGFPMFLQESQHPDVGRARECSARPYYPLRLKLRWPQPAVIDWCALVLDLHGFQSYAR